MTSFYLTWAPSTSSLFSTKISKHGNQSSHTLLQLEPLVSWVNLLIPLRLGLEAQLIGRALASHAGGSLLNPVPKQTTATTAIPGLLPPPHNLTFWCRVKPSVKKALYEFQNFLIYSKIWETMLEAISALVFSDLVWKDSNVRMYSWVKEMSPIL